MSKEQIQDILDALVKEHRASKTVTTFMGVNVDELTHDELCAVCWDMTKTEGFWSPHKTRVKDA